MHVLSVGGGSWPDLVRSCYVKANLSKIKKGTRLSKKFSLKGFRKKVIYYAQLFLVPFLEQIRYALSAYSGKNHCFALNRIRNCL